MISVQGLKVEFGSQLLFEDASFVINKSDRIALVGKNGAGKSTMLKIIAGEQNPTGGTVARQQDITFGYLPQHMVITDHYTVKQEVLKVFDHIKEIDRQIDEKTAQMAERTDYESDSYKALIDSLTHLNELRAMHQSENYEGEIEKTLLGLGFERTDFDRPTSEFSGGWRMRIELAKLLLRHLDVLLLDEPTNHLDIESITWLENFLTTKAGALLLVSHDKAFLDNVTNRTIEISCGKIYDYSVNYSHFVELRKERVEQQRRAYENQQKMIKDTEDFIERFRYKPTKAVQVQSRIKQLAKIKVIEIDEVDNSRLHLKFPPAPRSGDYPVIADSVAKSFGDHQVFHDVTLTIKRGEKVAFVGKNGAGKTTLVRCIMSLLPHDGVLKIGHNVKIGYFAQNQAQLLDPELTVFETIDNVATGDIRTRVNDLLGAFMFGGPASEKKVKVLSGGEKSRLAMLRLLLQPVNLLILDEPTNHLDIPTKEILKNAIREFDGTVIVVSHDRDFLDGLVEKVYEFGGGVVREHLGGIYDFLNSRNLDSLHELERNDASAKANEQLQPEVKQSKLNYLEQKEMKKKLRQAERNVSQLEEKINQLETEIGEIESTLAAGGAQSPEVYTKHSALTAELNDTMADWECASAELEQLKEQSQQ